MVRHNNAIPNGHFHKMWQKRIKTWFDQPMKKVHRKTKRSKRLIQLAPKPTQLLRPIVQCPSVRYNSKLRKGRGFTLQELKHAGLHRHYARTIGIAVDYRRRNVCLESLARNVQRLKEYKERLILFPLQEVVKTDSGKNLNVVKRKISRMQTRKVTEEEKKLEAFATLRRARCEANFGGVRFKRKMKKNEGIDASKV